LLGLSAKELEELARKKVIGKWADLPGARPPEGECTEQPGKTEGDAKKG
jgi:hypothetical protein